MQGNQTPTLWFCINKRKVSSLHSTELRYVLTHEAVWDMQQPNSDVEFNKAVTEFPWV